MTPDISGTFGNVIVYEHRRRPHTHAYQRANARTHLFGEGLPHSAARLTADGHHEGTSGDVVVSKLYGQRVHAWLVGLEAGHVPFTLAAFVGTLDVASMFAFNDEGQSSVTWGSEVKGEEEEEATRRRRLTF